MTTHYTEEDVVSRISSLTRTRLVSFVNAEIVMPLQSEKGPVFRQIDLARLQLLCDLCDQYDLQEDALGMVMSLVDQLHGVRAELRAVLDAIESEQDEVRARIAEVLYRARSGG